jgi:hypothetical protein
MQDLGQSACARDARKGGSVNGLAKGGKTSTASSRGDGIAQRGKTRRKDLLMAAINSCRAQGITPPVHDRSGYCARLSKR